MRVADESGNSRLSRLDFVRLKGEEWKAFRSNSESWLGRRVLEREKRLKEPFLVPFRELRQIRIHQGASFYACICYIDI